MPNLNFELALDFSYYWAAGRAAYLGLNPYDPAVLAELMQQFGYGFDGKHALFPHPPPSLFLFYIFGALPPELARNLWILICIVCVWLTWKLSCDISSSLASKHSSSISKVQLALFFCAFPPLLRAILLGQLTLLISLLSLWGLQKLFADKSAESGLIFACTAIKAQSLMTIGVSLLFTHPIRQICRLGVGFFSMTIALFIISEYLFPNSWSAFFRLLSEHNFELISLSRPSLMRWTGSYLNLVATAIFITGCVASVLVQRWSHNKKRTLFTLVAPLGLLSAPYGWVHESIILLPALLLFVRELPHNSQVMRMAILGIMVCGLFLLPQSKIEMLAQVIPLIFIIAGLWLEQAHKQWDKI
jgi:hypothetical protein